MRGDTLFENSSMADNTTLALVASTCQCLTIVCSLCAYIPQWRTLHRRKSSDDISLKSWLLWIGCALLGTFYSVTTYLMTGVGIALVCTDIAALCFITITISMILKYRNVRTDTHSDLREPIDRIVASAGEIELRAESVASCVRLTGSTAERREAQQH